MTLLVILQVVLPLGDAIDDELSLRLRQLGAAVQREQVLGQTEVALVGGDRDLLLLVLLLFDGRRDSFLGPLRDFGNLLQEVLVVLRVRRGSCDYWIIGRWDRLAVLCLFVLLAT